MRKRLILFFILILNISLVYALPPSLIHGTVIDDDGKEVENVPVVATWNDSSGKENSVMTYTFSKEDSINFGDNEVIGGYRIIIEYVDEDTAIRVETLGDLRIIKINPNQIYEVPNLKYSESRAGNESLESNLEYVFSIFSLAGKTYVGSSSEESGKSEMTLNSSRDLSGSGSQTINSNPDSSSDENIPNVNGFDGYPSDTNNEKIVKSSSNDEETNQDPATTNNGELKEFKINWTIVLGIGTLILILIGGLGLFLLIKKILNKKDKKSNKKLKVSIDKINKVKIKEFMNKDLFSVTPQTNIEEAMDLFVLNSTPMIPVVSQGIVRGLISKKDIIFKIPPEKYNELDKINVEEIIEREYTSCTPGHQLGELYQLLLGSKTNSVIVQKEGKLSGVVDYLHILEIFENANFTFDNPPRMNDAIDITIHTVDSSLNLIQLRDNLIKGDFEYAIVIENNKPIGIITLKDLIISIKKGIDFKMTKVKNVMSANVIILNPGNSIYDGIKIAVSRRFNQIPIEYENKIQGISTMRTITRSYYEFIDEINKSKNK
jgi:predicted transcriptional regulator